MKIYKSKYFFSMNIIAGNQSERITTSAKGKMVITLILAKIWCWEERQALYDTQMLIIINRWSTRCCGIKQLFLGRTTQSKTRCSLSDKRGRSSYYLHSNSCWTSKIIFSLFRLAITKFYKINKNIYKIEISSVCMSRVFGTFFFLIHDFVIIPFVFPRFRECSKNAVFLIN